MTAKRVDPYSLTAEQHKNVAGWLALMMKEIRKVKRDGNLSHRTAKRSKAAQSKRRTLRVQAINRNHDDRRLVIHNSYDGREFFEDICDEFRNPLEGH